MQGEYVRRRLRTKTAPAEAPMYPQRALLKKIEYNIRKAKLKKAQLEQRNVYRKMRAKAVELLSRQAPMGAFTAEEMLETGVIEHPHPSHSILALNGQNDTIYCKRCSWWSSRCKLRLLATPCLGLIAGNKSQLRLLQCGVMPSPTARTPPHLRFQKGRRRRRW